MNISRVLKETVSDVPKNVGNLIEFTKVEKWAVSKTSLLEQKQILEQGLLMRQSRLDEINNLLLMFDEEI